MGSQTPDVELRNWLIDYLITTVGCPADQVDPDTSFVDLGVGSRAAVVLSGELSERLNRPVSPIDFWQHPTVNELTAYLSGPQPQGAAASAGGDARHEDASSVDEPIAVVGVGCRFPGEIDGPDALWKFLADGHCAIGEVPDGRWADFNDDSTEVAAVLANTPRFGGFLSDPAAFDAEYFGISSREAIKMDPQQRLLLEVAAEALERAGIPATALSRSQTGVFIGACVSEYGYLASTDLPGIDAWSNTGGALSIIANRLSYLLDLRGPSVTVDTACSSSLVAVHLACQSLRLGESTTALAGGVNLLLSPSVFHGFAQAGVLSPTGVCSAFGAAADGFVRGEGTGIVVLKRLSDARRDGDPVLAVIRGSAVNSDGRSNGLMAPNPAAQMAVLRTAYAAAGVAPREVDYVETHGTGTLLGDPIEARALGAVLGRGRPVDAPLLIGAIKPNLGHLEAAAGIAGFIKAVLAVQRGTIPGTINFGEGNPHIPFEQARLQVVAEQRPWPYTERPRRAGVSSFGFGGTNAHVVIEQAREPESADSQFEPSATTTLVITGQSDERIAATAGSIAEWMSGAGAHVALSDVAHTLNHHRATHPRFATVCARSRAGAVDALRRLAAGQAGTGVVLPHQGTCGTGTVFVYSGQGSHWAGMGRRLMADEPVFAAALAEIEPVFVERVHFSLHDVLAEGQAIDGDAQVQPVIMGLQLALTRLWEAYGVTPDAVIGHSMGEITAAVVSGALSISEGLRVIGIRSRLMSKLAGRGAVALLDVDADDTATLVADHPGIDIAGYLSDRQTVIAGPPDGVDAVIDAVRATNRFARRVNMAVASHNALMDPILPELHSALGEVVADPPMIPFISTVTDPLSAPPLDADYWVANVRQPVRLSRAITVAAEDHTTFIEVSPHPTLTHAISATVESLGHHHSIGTLWRDGDDTVSFHTSLNAIQTLRPPRTPHPPEPHPMLPTTPWQHGHYWVDSSPPGRRRGGAAGWPAAAGDAIPADWHLTLAWPERPLPVTSQGASRSWLVVAEPDTGAEFAAALGADGSVQVVDPAVVWDTAVLTSALDSADHVLYAPESDDGRAPAERGYRLFNTGRRLAVALADRVEAARPGKLVLLTRNGQPLDAGDRANPAHAVLWGLGRTAALEHPEIWAAVIDVDASVPAALAATYVRAELAAEAGEDQIVYRAGRRRVPRLQPGTAAAAAPVELDPAASHLVIGATGNIGPHLIRQLAAMGATTVVAVSRNPGNRLDALAAELAKSGTALVPVATDAADRNAMSALFARFGTELPALGGVYAAAFGGGPVTLSGMTDADVAEMFTPKLDAVTLAHELSLAQPVQQFVVFSSISGVTGSRWLAHYAATTTFLDTFAYGRRAAGLPATAINWGLWESLTHTHDAQQNRITTESGLEPMPDTVAIQALPWLIGPTAPVRSAVVAADWPRLAAAYRSRAALHIVDDLLLAAAAGTAAIATATAFRATLAAAQPERRMALLTDHVADRVVTAMGLGAPQCLDPHAGFFQAGMDSLMSVTLQRSLGDSLGVTLPASVVFDYPTVEALAGYLATILPELAEATPTEAADNYDDLTEDELLKQLSERLS